MNLGSTKFFLHTNTEGHYFPRTRSLASFNNLQKGEWPLATEAASFTLLPGELKVGDWKKIMLYVVSAKNEYALDIKNLKQTVLLKL